MNDVTNPLNKRLSMQAISAGSDPLQKPVLALQFASLDDMHAAVRFILDMRHESRPAAWMKGYVSHSGPNGPDEHDVDLVYGDDPPPGEGWMPLYARPAETAALAAFMLPYGARVAGATRKPAGIMLDHDPAYRDPPAGTWSLEQRDVRGGRRIVEAIITYRDARDRLTLNEDAGATATIQQSHQDAVDEAWSNVGLCIAAWYKANASESAPNSAFRWICNKCEAVNGHEAASCVACRTPRYPFTAAQAYAARTNLMAAVAASPTFTGTPTIAGTPAVEKLTEWLVRALVALAKSKLDETNADSERGNGAWPADQEWHELNATSQSIFMHRARDAAGIDRDQYLGYIRECPVDLETLWKSLDTDPAAAADILPPVAWMAGDGRLMSHAMKESLKGIAGDNFVIPLHPHRTEPATTCAHKLVDGIALTACGKELESRCSDWDFCPYCGDPVELVE